MQSFLWVDGTQHVAVTLANILMLNVIPVFTFPAEQTKALEQIMLLFALGVQH
jgi:hypothetical protein